MIVKPASPGVFKWGYVFQRGDLPLFVTDTAGNPVSPYKVTYTLYRYAKDACAPMRVGPCGRTPVMADIGEYYVSGVAGQCGQPGSWYVEWKLEQSFGSALMTERFGFTVFDTSQLQPATYGTVSCGCGGGCLTQTGSCGKFGW